MFSDQVPFKNNINNAIATLSEKSSSRNHRYWDLHFRFAKQHKSLSSQVSFDVFEHSATRKPLQCEDRLEQQVVRIDAMWEDAQKRKCFEGHWYYSPEETTCGRLVGHDKRELFETAHVVSSGE